MSKRRTYLIQNPYAPEAQRFITTFKNSFGLRPVCVYTDPKARHYLGREFPLLAERHVEASIETTPDELTGIADRISDDFEVLAVIPWEEDYVAPAGDLCAVFGIAWNPPETVRRFRDKHSLKTFLGERGIRVPISRIVASPDDVYRGEVPPRFVVKPNDGSGNLDVSIFDRDDRDAVAAKLAAGGHTWVMEEFVGGEEYHIDGQIRPDGSVTVLGLYQYRRTTVGDCDTVYEAERSVHTDEPVFDDCVRYATALLTASELRASPFHMEVKVDERGPAMIDLGARFGSEGVPETINRMHPGRPDVYWVAAHDYLGVQCDLPPVDFTYYDSIYQAWAYGISESHAQIVNVSGLDEVERMPEFIDWAILPEIGRHLVPTTNLGTVPWIAEFDVRGDLDAVDRVIDTAHRLVQLNVDPSRTDRTRAVSVDLVERVLAKSRWIAHRARGTVGISR